MQDAVDISEIVLVVLQLGSGFRAAQTHAGRDSGCNLLVKPHLNPHMGPTELPGASDA